MSEKAFTWKKNEIPKAVLSQCADCVHNKGKVFDDCSIYGKKPEGFWRNNEKCPGRKIK